MNIQEAAHQNSIPVLQVQNLSKHYSGTNGKQLIAVNDVSFSINEGEVLGIVGESGCGKSTLGRTVLRLVEATSGKITYLGQDITTPLLVHKLGNSRERASRVVELLGLVGLPTDAASKYPHEFSGGQRQRIAIARALASNPTFLVCDEAVSALDVSVQSQILNLLMDLRQKLNLAMMFISHDLSVIRHISDRVAVMYLGKIVECAVTEELMSNPLHPYTQALLSAIPHPLGEQQMRIILQGELPDAANPPAGCVFHTRCHKRNASVDAKCVASVPELHTYSDDRQVACHLHIQPNEQSDRQG